MLAPRLMGCVLFWLVMTYVTCTPFPTQKSTHAIRQSEVGVVTGVKTRDGNGNVYIRREIRDLMNNFPDQWSLYILALNEFHKTPQNNPNSFYGLASIHGRPYEVWGDAMGIPSKIGKAGYCPHGNELFLGWHRPYLALFEQILSGHVHDIAGQAPADQIERYLAAADEFRIPYWDWAQGITTGPVPDIFTSPYLTVTDTDRTPVVVTNPLYAYTFHPVPEGFDMKWRQMSNTVRWPENDSPNATSQQFKFVDAFRVQSTNLIVQVGVAFRSSTFSRFSSILEDPHGWIHGVIGGGYNPEEPWPGHMWPLEYSSYEPLFMLHHANVDRLLALYQGAHPDRWMKPSNIGPHGNVYLEDFQTVSADTDLMPFRKAPGQFLTFNDCRNTTVFGYVYPETRRWNFESDEAYQKSVTATIANLYSGRTRAQARVQVTTQYVTAFGQALLDNNNTYTEWTIETQAVASMLPPTFMVSFSLIGLFQSDPITDLGSWMMLMPERDDVRTTDVQSKPENKMNGTTSITSYLIDRVNAHELSSLDPNDVVPYLASCLTWNVYDEHGDRIPFPDDETLKVEVFGTRARLPNDPNAPIEYSKGDATPYPEITAGKIKGANQTPPGMMPP
ncbi:hypothetical protein ACET3X_007005 [Alternaria dauci]|uniref:tyrosinase n=1 Tax=Alternaria dauci TaxID=48095 RepID=A0ABR3UFU1_9PLEO